MRYGESGMRVMKLSINDGMIVFHDVTDRTEQPQAPTNISSFRGIPRFVDEYDRQTDAFESLFQTVESDSGQLREPLVENEFL
jgi:hypothetical protein